jgi:RNA polymerase sigma-70 factor (ECF subfamily)
MTEQEAISRAQNGDAAAFEYLYQSHARRIFALCLRMTGNPTDAEDLTQEAFLQVFRKIHTFRGESAFSTWLHRLSVNIVLMRFRKKTVSVTSLEENSGDEGGKPPKEVGASDPALVGSIDRVVLERAMAQLPPGYRRTFVLHDVLGYEHNEIATKLGCSIGNSKSQLHKARARLRKLLQQTTGENPHRKEFQLEFAS